MTTIEIVLGVVLLVLAYEVIRLRKVNKQIVNIKVNNENLSSQNKELMQDVLELEDTLGEEREKNRNLLSQKKSSETRLGQISEHIVPFLEKCPYNPKDMHFMGNPIDYLVFDLDDGKIVFSEVKSGNSKASKRQKTIKNIIKSGRVFYEEIRINTKGVTIKPTYPEYFKPKLEEPPKRKRKQLKK